MATQAKPELQRIGDIFRLVYESSQNGEFDWIDFWMSGLKLNEMTLAEIVSVAMATLPIKGNLRQRDHFLRRAAEQASPEDRKEILRYQ